MIELFGPRLFGSITADERGIKRRDRLFDGGPFRLTLFVFGDAGLQAALVLVRAGIADVLLAVGLSKKQAQADATRRLSTGVVETLGARNRGCQIEDVLEGGGRVLRLC